MSGVGMRTLMVPRMAIAPKPFAKRRPLGADAIRAGRLDLRPIGNSLRFHDEHRARSIRDDVLRHRPEQELHDPRSTVRTDDDEIGREIGSELNDLARRISNSEMP